jgi:hypothetical protein
MLETFDINRKKLFESFLPFIFSFKSPINLSYKSGINVAPFNQFMLEIHVVKFLKFYHLLSKTEAIYFV